MPQDVALYEPSKLDLIKRTVAKGATDDELALFLHACKRTGLDPLMKQIHAIKRWSAQDQRETMAIQTGIDGYRLIAERTGKYAGSDEPMFEECGGVHPAKATVTVWKLVDGQRCAFTASARWEEYVQKKKDGSVTSFWTRMPYGQLSKCAEALALRKAFPAELSGVYTHEEMQQADNPIVINKPVLDIPQVRPRNDATMVQPATDKYTGEPIRQQGDGTHQPDTSTDGTSAPAKSDAPAAPSSAKAFCDEQAAKAATDEHTAEGFIGTYTPRLAGKSSPPGRFVLETLRGELTLQFWEKPEGMGTPNHSYAKVTYRQSERAGKGGKTFTNNELLSLQWAAPRE